MSLRLPKITFIFDRYSKASTQKKAVVEMRITYERKQKYISTGIFLFPKQWKDGVIFNHENALELNNQLDKMLIDVRQVIMEMSEEKNIDIQNIPMRLKRKTQGATSFLDFCRQRANVRMYGKTADSQERYRRFLRLFSKWGKIVEFEDITESNLIAYDKYLASRGLKIYSKWNNYHRFLNSFILDAMNEGYLKRNPYYWVKIEKGKTSSGYSRCLSPKEFNQIRKAVMPTESLTRVQDLFIFQTYTCLSYSDLKDFDSGNIHKIKNMNVYLGARNKTSKPFTVPLLPQAVKILKKYNNTLPVISNVKYNEYLKIVAQASKVDKPVSSHWARHTGATLLLNEGVNMQIVSKICGHSSTRMTEQVYAKLLDETVVDAIRNMEKKTSHLSQAGGKQKVNIINKRTNPI